MAVGKEIRTKIKSIQNTQKITKAMEMVAASKMRKAQDRMVATKPYAEKIREVVSHIAASHTEYKHPYLSGRTVKKIGMIIVSTDRGLCGGLNVNLFKKALKEITEWEKKGYQVDVVTFGGKALSFFRRLSGLKLIAETSQLGDKPEVTEVVGPVHTLLQEYANGEVDEIFLLSNEFENTMSQIPKLQQLVPVEPCSDKDLDHHWDYIYEPGAKEVLTEVLDRYIESQVYQAVVENVACEMSARMIAMKAATDNAGELIKELQQIYNRERQAAITQEISEIVAGAAAV